jgi:hypothetical protein
MAAKGRYFGIAAQFESPEELMAAVRKTREAGYTRMDAYTPFPLHGLTEEMRFRDERVPIFMFLGGLIGGISGFFLQTYTNAWDYPFNVGGRPLIGYPAWVPITFECTILFSALTGVLSMIMLNGLPQPYDPMFNIPSFARASQDRFFLCIEARDPNFKVEEVTAFMEGLGAESVEAVPR